MNVVGGGGVFVSYRREGGGDAAGRLADRLVDRFGAERVFMDVDAIEPGMDYVDAITRAVSACAVLVAVIGPGWLTAADKRGRRLDDPDDWVRVEVRTALARGVRVIPALVGGAHMPAREDLPSDLAGLARRNALRIRHESFRVDAGQLVAVIERALTSSAPAAVSDETSVSAGDVPNRETRQDTAAGKDDALYAIHRFVDAEHIAYSMTDESAKASALSSIAGAVAAADPDWAERIAGPITDEHMKGWALNSIAGAVAGADPDRAGRIAGSITYEPAKGRALSSVARAVAVTDPDRAGRIADSITDESAKVSALSNIARSRI
jgi:TIR domain